MKNLREQLNEVAGNWNGEDNDIREDRALIAYRGLEIVEELEEILKDLNIKGIIRVDK